MANPKSYSNSGGFECDIKEIYEMFKDFTLNEMNRAVQMALGNAAKILRNQAKTNLKQRLTKSTKRNPAKYADTLVDAIRIGKVHKGDAERMVHIMGVRDKYSGTFRTRFFEKGVPDMSRKTKDGKRIFGGEIKGLYFFRDAIVQTKDEVIQAIDEELNKAVQTINDKKFNVNGTK